MIKITNQNFLTNKFSRSNTKKILNILNNFVAQSQSASQLINLLTQQANEFCWYVGQNPAYFIQYQVDSVAILKINNFSLIVWKPKYIQYPAMIQFPQLKDIKSQSLRLQVDKQITNISDGNLSALLDFLQKFISTYCRTDQSFQTNLVTYAKHFVSKKTALSYWHCIYDNADKMALRNQKNMECIAKIRISGIKKGYNKCLLLFSCKGSRDNVLSTIKSKWMQTLSFLAMATIFVSIVSCDSGDTQGLCQYRDQAMVGGAGIMMALFGIKMAKRQKKKPHDKLKQN